MILITPMNVSSFYIKAGSDRIVNEENKNDLSAKFTSPEVILYFFYSI